MDIKSFKRYIEGRIVDVLEGFDPNEAQGGDFYWEANGGRSQREERRYGGIVIRRDWVCNLISLCGSGYQDERLQADYDKFYERMLKDYHEEFGPDAPEDSDEFYDYESEYLYGLEDTDFIACAEFNLEGHNEWYRLVGELYRTFDYNMSVFGVPTEICVRVQMDLDEDELTEANADKFLTAFENALKDYSFGKDEVEIDVEKTANESRRPRGRMLHESSTAMPVEYVIGRELFDGKWWPIIVYLNQSPSRYWYAAICADEGGVYHTELGKGYLSRIRPGTDKCAPEVVDAVEDEFFGQFAVDDIPTHRVDTIEDLERYVPADKRLISRD